MKTLIKNVQLVLADRLMSDAWLVAADGLIDDYGQGEPPAGNFDAVYDGEGQYLSPGFVDMHVHGAAGFDFFDGTEEAILTVLRAHL